jgi:hypothetical protein
MTARGGESDHGHTIFLIRPPTFPLVEGLCDRLLGSSTSHVLLVNRQSDRPLHRSMRLLRRYVLARPDC